MDRTSGVAPLLSLDAVVIDTETTGLDPRKARVIELAGVRLSAGKLAAGDQFRQLLRPADEPIPAETTRIHGIDDAMVAERPVRRCLAQLQSLSRPGRGDRHTVGFDLAMLKRECDLAGLPWIRPRTLDTRLLAQIVAPELAGYALEKLAAWLGVEVVEPAFRARRRGNDRAGVSGAGAQAARPRHPHHCRSRAGLPCPHFRTRRSGAERLGRGRRSAGAGRCGTDTEALRQLAYRHRNRDIMRTPPVFVDSGTSVHAALARLSHEKISAVYVGPAAVSGNLKAADAGIVTERDLLRAIARSGAAALDLPVGQIMSRPLAAVPADAFVYRAIGRMNRLKTRHLGVVDESGSVVGALSARDLLRLRAGEAISLGDEIDDAADAHALALAWAKLPQVAESLRAEGLSGRDIAEVISRELGALTRQAAVIAERIMRERARASRHAVTR